MAYVNMGRTSRYSRNSASSASVSNFSISSSLMGEPLWLRWAPVDRDRFAPFQNERLCLLCDAKRDVVHAFERDPVDRGRPVQLERVPMLARAVSAVRVEAVFRKASVIPIHRAVPRH